MMASKTVREFLAEAGRRGGKARTRKKLKAVAANMRKAQAKRWPKKGGSR